MYSGLILNELLTNSFKYAFKESGTITITTLIKEGTCYLVVGDDGFGYEDKQTSSLGLTIIRTLAKKQLKGNVEIDSKHGTKTTISWSINE